VFFSVSVQIVRDADYKAPRARRAALRRTASGNDPFADFNFLRPASSDTQPAGGSRDDLAVLEEDEDEEDGGGYGASSAPDRRPDDGASAAAAGPLQMQWEFEVRAPFN
jgi:hypothetical protein